MKFFHLSHTDLDGYSAQFVTKAYFDNIIFFNSNYGKEIEEKFAKIVSLLDDEEAIILITDLNLTIKQCEDFENTIRDKKTKLLLLDHHQSGVECAQKFSWYYLDNSRCATLITYDFFASIYGQKDDLCEFCKMVNAVDIWLKDDKYFEFGKVCLNLIANSKEINKVMFSEKSNEYVYFLLRKANEFMWSNVAHINLDDNIHKIKKEYFFGGFNDTLSNMISCFIVNNLSSNKEKFSINYKEYKGILTHNIGNTSVIGNEFLERNPEFDFFMDVSSKKTISLRANNKLDVSLMAADLFNGGGHKNASGGLFASFKDSFDYENIKNQIKDHILKKTIQNKEEQ